MAGSSQIDVYESNFLTVANSTFLPACYTPEFNRTTEINSTSAIANITSLNDFTGVYDQYAKLHIANCGDLRDYYATYRLYNDYCDGDCGDKQRDGIITAFNDYSEGDVLHGVLCQAPAV